MISVVVATENSAKELPDTLEALVPGAISGLVSEVIVVDAGSGDATLDIADGMGAQLVRHQRGGRGAQLAAGAATAKGEWLLFVPADVVLEQGWHDEVATFMRSVKRSSPRIAGAFRFALDDPSPAARRSEFLARVRNRLIGLPRGDQGLLISRRFYDELGGFRPLAAFEDIDLTRRIGPARLVLFRSGAFSSAARYAKRGPVQSARRLIALALCSLRAPVWVLARLAG